MKVNPTESQLKEARSIVVSAIEECRDILEKKKEVMVALSWIEDDFVKNKMGGATGETVSAVKMNIRFNSSVENWKKNLKATVVHEFAHTWLHEKRNTAWKEIEANWEQILLDAHAQHLTEQIMADYREPMADAVTDEYIQENWKEIREVMEKGIDEGRYLFYGNKHLKNWTGYTVAYRIGGKLLEDHGLEDFPELEKADVVEAGNKIFGAE